MEGPPMLAIKEANTHLQALHERNVKLEEQVIHLTAMLQNRQQQQSQIPILEKTISEKDQEVILLKQQVKSLRSQIQENNKKDLIISQLTRKVKILNEILKYKSALDSISDCLEQVEQDFIVDIDNLVQLDAAAQRSDSIDDNANLITNGLIDDDNNHVNNDQETCL